MIDGYTAAGQDHPERTTRQQEARARTVAGAPCPLCNGQGKLGGCKCGIWADHETVDAILASLADWRTANPRKRWPPRRVSVSGKPGFIMSRDMGCTQIATGTRPDGTPEWDWYFRSEYELA